MLDRTPGKQARTTQFGTAALFSLVFIRVGCIHHDTATDLELEIPVRRFELERRATGIKHKPFGPTSLLPQQFPALQNFAASANPAN